MTASERIRAARAARTTAPLHIDPRLREEFRFMLANGGYSVPPGRAASALELARARLLLEQAEALGVAAVSWLDDDLPYDAGGAYAPEEAERLFSSGEWDGPYGLVVSVGADLNEERPYDTCEQSTSLWGIVLNGTTRGRDPYARVVEAELAYELLDELRQAIGDKLDAERCTP